MAIQSNQPYHDSLTMSFADMHNYTVFAPNTGAYESIKSLGLSLVEDDSIRLACIKLYDQDYPTLIENNKNFIDQIRQLKMGPNVNLYQAFHLFDLDFLNARNGHYGGQMLPLNFEKLKQDQVFNYHLHTLKNDHEYYIIINQMNKDRAIALIRRIEVYLNK